MSTTTAVFFKNVCDIYVKQCVREQEVRKEVEVDMLDWLVDAQGRAEILSFRLHWVTDVKLRLEFNPADDIGNAHQHDMLFPYLVSTPYVSMVHDHISTPLQPGADPISDYDRAMRGI